MPSEHPNPESANHPLPGYGRVARYLARNCGAQVPAHRSSV